MGLAAAGWMIVALRLAALRAILITNYVGLRTGMMLRTVRREPSMLDVWILNAWLVLTGALEFAFAAFLFQVALRRRPR